MKILRRAIVPMSSYSIDTIEYIFKLAGWDIIATIEQDDKKVQIIGYSEDAKSPMKGIEIEVLPETVDWQEQTRLASPYYKNGVIQIDVQQFGKTFTEKSLVTLAPGPAFGDLSHPTTNLMLQLIPEYVSGKYVLDIGTGNGILAIAAALFGSLFTWGIDIDENALQLGRCNVHQNGLDQSIWIGCKEDLTLLGDELVILMNMITSEMDLVFQTVLEPFLIPGVTICSGILREQKEKFIKQQTERGWKFLQEKTEGSWVAVAFLRGRSNARS